VSSGRNANGGPDRDAAGGFGGAASRRLWRRRRGGVAAAVVHRGGRRLRRARDSRRVWGFASDAAGDRVRNPADHRHRGGSGEGQCDREEGGRQAGTGPCVSGYWATPLKKEPGSISTETKQAFVAEGGDAAVKVKGVSSVIANVGINNEWKYFASTEGSYIEQETSRSRHRSTCRQGRRRCQDRAATSAVSKTGGWEGGEESEMLESAERIANEAVEMTTAKPIGMG